MAAYGDRMIKNKQAIWLLAAFLLLLTFLSYWLYFGQKERHIAHIYLEGELIKELDLSAAAEPYTFKAEANYYNIIEVAAGQIKVIEANCPDQLCVKQGYLQNSPIICLPNQMIIEFKE